MPKIIKTDVMNVEQSEDGWQVRTVADASIIGYPAMVAKWWIFEPNTKGPEQTRSDADELLYVISGTGQAVVGGDTFQLDEESVLWLEEGDQYHIIAGNSGIEILQAYAPGENSNDESG